MCLIIKFQSIHFIIFTYYICCPKNDSVAIKKATSTTPSGKNAQPNLFLTLKEKGES